tara:strand:- start:3871 stop:4356 length:486 start_codon:yes stop_codon:yes gene_type:complete
MPIYEDYSGRKDFYTPDENARLEDPERYGYTQATYNAFAERTRAKAEGRREADERAREAIPSSYTQSGLASTNPFFSLGGYSGHSGGELSGGAGLAFYEDGGMVAPDTDPSTAGMFQYAQQPVQGLPQQPFNYDYQQGLPAAINQGLGSLAPFGMMNKPGY